MTNSDPIAELIRLKWDETERSSSEARQSNRETLRTEHTQRGTAASAARWIGEAQVEIATIEKVALQCLADLTNKDVVPDHARDEGYWRQLEQTLPARATAQIHSAIATILRDAETHGHLSGGVQIGLHQLESQHQASIRHDLQTRARSLRVQERLQMKSAKRHAKAKQRSWPDKKKVFIVHGRLLEARREMGLFVRSLGLEPLNFEELSATLGGTPSIADVVTKGMEVAHGVIVLFTAEEFATLRPSLRIATDTDLTIKRWQARSNVIFEAGMAFNRDRKRVVFVEFGSVSLFTDIGGIHILRPTNASSGDRSALRSKLKGMGCAIDSMSSDWIKTGDFESWIPSPESVAEFVQPTDIVSDTDASIRLRGWLSKLPGAKSGHAQSFSDIGVEAGVSPDQVHRLLPPVVEHSGTRWRIPDFGATVAILVLEALPPMPRRPDRFGGGY